MILSSEAASKYLPLGVFISVKATAPVFKYILNFWWYDTPGIKRNRRAYNHIQHLTIITLIHTDEVLII